MSDVVDLACLAPSVHNTQPWSWRIVGSSLELYADRSRLLTAADPSGHDLIVSCGAALHHAQVAALGLGWEPTVERHPLGEDGDLLARIELTPASPTPGQVLTLETLRQRRTDRRRLTSWPVPDQHLRDLATRTGVWGVIATALTEPTKRLEVEKLVGRAADVQASDPAIVEEQLLWTDHSSGDGVPSAVLPSRAPSTDQPNRFHSGQLDDATDELESSDGLIVLGTVADSQEAWLRVGEALSALWLDATAAGLSVVPLSNVVEVAETRDALQRDVLVSLAVPHALLRVGWQSVSRTPLPPTPRRPLADVLRDSVRN